MTFAKTLASAAALMADGDRRRRPQDANPAVIFDLGGKFDKSFNQAAFNGAERFKTETGIAYASSSCRTTPSASRRCAASPSSGNNPIVVAGFSCGIGDGDGRAGVPRHQVRDHRRGRRPAERALGRLQGAGRLLPRRRARGDGVEDRQGRLRRRHGHPADPQVRLRLRPGRQGGEPRRRGVPEHDRHHRRGLERPGQGRRARQEPDRPGRRRRLRTRPAAPASACCRRRPTPASSASASTPTRTTCIPARC